MTAVEPMIKNPTFVYVIILSGSLCEEDNLSAVDEMVF